MNAPLAHHILEPPSEAVEALFARVFAELRPLPPMSCGQWAETYRQLSKEETDDFPGPFDLDNAPATRGILEVIGTKGVKRCVGQKSAQITWTGGVICSVLGYHVHYRPCVQVAMFPREKSAKDFDAEKFAPMVRATPVLRERIRLKSRSDGNSATRKHYPGGLIKFVASNSPSDVKSTTARVLIVEEPDDVNKDVKGQGNAITMLRERGKTVRNSFMLIGGTPSVKGVSEIEKEMRTTDQRRFMVPCHHCDEAHEVEFEHVVIPGLNLSDEELQRPDIDTEWPLRDVYGRARWEDAYYACPHCGGLWSDDERIDNIRRAARVAPLYGWEPTADAADPGFYFNELQSVFDGSRVPILAEKYLRAKHLLDAGDATDMIVFENATRGRAWEYNQGDLPEEDALRERAEPYTEWSVPAMGALVPVMFADIQHDRIAVCVWVIGRGEEMWLAYWGEHWGKTVVPDAGAWLELEQLLTSTVRHPSGAELPLAAIAVDTGDGQTSDASYAFVRKHHKRDRQVLATKGASDSVGRVEIWTKPKAIDPNKRSTKAAKAGVHVHTIGAAKAKDLILGWAAQAGRVRLTGNGPGRLHWYQGVRDDFFEQLLSEIKVPSRTRRGVREWKKRTDRANEGLDCYDDQTDVLTARGWMRFASLTEDDLVATVNLDSDLIEYQRPEALIERDYDGELLCVEGKMLNFAVTPNHRMVTYRKKFKNKKWNFDVPPQITLARDLDIHHTVKISGRWEPSQTDPVVQLPESRDKINGRIVEPARVIDAKALATLLGWYVSEGSLFVSRGGYRVHIAQSKASGRTLIEQALRDLPWNWNSDPRAFTIVSKQLHDYIVSVCPGKSPERLAPEWIKWQSREVIEAFVSAAVDGDGWIQDGARSYATTSRGLADDMMELMFKLGGSPSLTVRPPKAWNIRGKTGQSREQYHVRENNGRKSRALDGAGHQFMVKPRHYVGKVYCATVPNGTLVVRRQGKVMVCGNCTVGSVWLSRHLRLHLRRAEQWLALEQRLNPDGVGLQPPQFAKPADPPASSHRRPDEALPPRPAAPAASRLPQLQVGAGTGGRVSITNHARFSSGSRGGR